LIHINVEDRAGTKKNRVSSIIGENVMAETSKVPVKPEKAPTAPVPALRPFESLRREIDRLFEDFDGGLWPARSRRSFFDMAPFSGPARAAPAVDFAETDKGYEVTAELPGMDEKDIEVKFADGVLTIKGEKQDEKEEKKKDYYLHERSYGSFHRALQLPNGIDEDKIEATFKKGVLKVTLPKSAEAQKAEKKIAVKAA
jgi:HSP20 family protein